MDWRPVTPLIVTARASHNNNTIISDIRLSLLPPSLSPPDRGAVGRLELEHHGQQGGVDVPDTGEDEGDDGEAGDAPDDAHLDVQEPGRQVGPLLGPELPAASPLQ